MISIVDLTHTILPDIAHWDDEPCFSMKTVVDYAECTPPNLFRVQKFEAKAGLGTHIDAPAHCIPDGKTIEQLDLEALQTDCIVIDVSHVMEENYPIPASEVENFEIKHGQIPAGTFVIFYTGWSKFWNEPKKYRNDLKFPSIHVETAQMLLDRNVAGVGIDTLSPDAIGTDFPVHRLLLGAGKYIVENVANAGALPPTGSKVAISPLKIGGATESPVRLTATVYE